MWRDYTLQAFLEIPCYFQVVMCYREETALIIDNDANSLIDPFNWLHKHEA